MLKSLYKDSTLGGSFHPADISSANTAWNLGAVHQTYRRLLPVVSGCIHSACLGTFNNQSSGLPPLRSSYKILATYMPFKNYSLAPSHTVERDDLSKTILPAETS